MLCSASKEPVTRSRASFGRTYILRPTAAPPATTHRKTTTVNRRNMIYSWKLNFDVHNLLHDPEAEKLQEHTHAEHHLPDFVFEEESDVIRIRKEHQHADGNGNGAKR